MNQNKKPIVIVGAGFTGLAAGLQLVEKGYPVTILEQDSEVGGLAGTFEINGTRLEKFYHHWFNNDKYVMDLIHELNLQHNILLRPTNTGMYYANKIFRLSNPIDVLKFTPLSLLDRIRLGLLVFKVQKIKDWRPLENYTVKEWLIKLCGQKVYEVVWEPLLVGKFGPYAEVISAVWFWKKLALRGSSRSKSGAETLAYYKGGFAALAMAMADKIKALGGNILMKTTVKEIKVEGNKVTGVLIDNGEILAEQVIATPALPIIADLAEKHLPIEYAKQLRRIPYLSNKCLVLELSRSLSNTYWLNVNDPSFPYVGVIEHTNFEPSSSYGGSHIVYLSRYLPRTDELYNKNSQEIYEFSLPYIKKMFPHFDTAWVKNYYVWTADYAQPIVEKHYSQMVPDYITPIKNLYISSMAQIYPEDRGTNYAIREGKKIASLLNNANEA